jgi:hypothetical protein
MANNPFKEEIDSITERLIHKTIEVNRLWWLNPPERIRGILNTPDGVKQWQQVAQNAWLNAYTGLAKMYFQHVENVLDYSLQLAKQLQVQSDTAAVSPTSVERPKAAILPLSGQSGAVAKTAFALNSKASQVQAGQISCMPFFSELDERATDLELLIEPKEFELSPGEACPFEVTVFIPADTPVGSYRSQVIIAGFEDSQFDVLLEVQAPAELD